MLCGVKRVFATWEWSVPPLYYIITLFSAKTNILIKDLQFPQLTHSHKKCMLSDYVLSILTQQNQSLLLLRNTVKG